MRRLSRSLALAPVAMVLSLGCGATPPPAPGGPPPAPVAPPPPPPDITAVPVPPNLVFFGRASNVAQSVRVATDWAKLPSVEASTLFEGVLEGVTSGKEYDAFAALVDMTKPIDFAASFEVKLPPKGYGAISAAVKDVESAKAALRSNFDLVPGDNGIVRLDLHGAPKDKASEKSDDDPSVCELAPSAGASAYRVVCASSRDALSALGPYLTRTTPRQAIPADLHLELRAGPVGGFATLGRLQASTLVSSLLGLDPAADPATSELVTATLGDIFDYLSDLDTTTFDLTLDPAHAGLVYRTNFKSQVSLLARLTTAHPERVDVPPEALWRMPADIDLASFGSGADEADIKHPRDLLTKAVDEQLKKHKLGDADRHAVTEAVGHMMRGDRGVFAHGVADGASYFLAEEDSSPATVERFLRELVTTWNRPGFAKWLTSPDRAGKDVPVLKVGGPLPHLPHALHVTFTLPTEGLAHAARAAKGGKSGGLAGKAHPPAAASTAPPIVYHAAVVGDGTHSWFGLSSSPTALAAALLAVSTPSTTLGATLGAHATERGLAPFKDSRMSGGAFATVRGFVELARGAIATTEPTQAARLASLLAHLPSKGDTPMIMTAISSAPTPELAGGARELRIDIPADAIRDAVWFGMQLDP